MLDSLVPVAVACPCPGTPHSDGDTVFLSPKIGFNAGVIADSKLVDILRGSGDVDAVKAALLTTYITDGVRAWTFVDAEGADIKVTPESIAAILLSDYELGVVVAEAADPLYSKAVTNPLLRRMSESSPTSPTNGSTSRKRGSSAKRPKASEPSLTSITPTDST